MRKILHTLPYYLVLLFFYWPFYELIFLLITDPLVQKGVLINNLFFYSPLATFLVSFLYCYRHHFTMWWLLGVALIFCFTILTLNDFILLYLLAYEVCALIGLACGAGLRFVFMKKKV
ncbi:hypothetical protein BTU63_07295 [Streptococcus rubneri]|uniref:MFS transporter n=1 Tax=Streptococcus rubneri TaxID=1234680 RepID=A0A4Z1DTS8_9STRE|nr:hypothetical protein [Streptococcus rubneri]MBK4774696.1 hypothetical protein [Streptococcus rubneri]TGN91891.1 hypothetical protein E5S68_02775 [Streptococcus rubneri]